MKRPWTNGLTAVLMCALCATHGLGQEPSSKILRLPPINGPAMSASAASTTAESDAAIQNRVETLESELDQVRSLMQIQQQQSELLKTMLDRTTEQVSASSQAGPSEEVFEQIERLKIGVLRGAERDQEIQFQFDRLTEGLDFAIHNPQLPSTLRETFLPTRFDQTPLVIYNTLQTGYTDFRDADGAVANSAWLPHFYLLLRERFQIQVNPLITKTSLQILSAQIDFFVNDHLMISAGRFYSPLGFYPEKLHTSWVTKTPDTPLLFQQIYPFLLSFNGIQFRGGRYIGKWPVKLEYSAIATNGMSLDLDDDPTEFDFANFNPVRTTFREVNNDKAFGGRIGLSFPTLGLIIGASALGNGAYDPTGREDLTFIDFDANYHRGNWDVRFEYARIDQQTPFGPIDREGYYLQAAYRNYRSIHPFWGKLEGVVRYDWVDFEGIDLAVTGLDFGTRERIPIDRERYTAGLNYYFYPTLILKLAYEFNNERDFIELDDDGFLAQLTIGF